MKLIHETLMQKVEKVMREHASAKDNDIFLYTWLLNDHWHVDIHKVSAIDFLRKMNDGQLPKLDSVSRLRRELQEKDETLRGREWKSRHKEAEELRMEFA